jgi:chitinase
MFSKAIGATAIASSLIALSSAAPTPAHPSVWARQEAAGSYGITAWWGQSEGSLTLDEVCASENVDTVAISFLSSFWHGGRGGPSHSLWPTLNIGRFTQFPTAAQTAANAPGLFDGSALVEPMKKCQAGGKKLLLSIGGQWDIANVTFGDDHQASAFAHNFWSLFLGGTGNSTTDPIRPFGTEVILDGIDLDPEKGLPAGYNAFLTQLQSLMAADTSKQYTVSATPQCFGHSKANNEGDKSLPDSLLKHPVVNEVNVQFYNNAICQHPKGADWDDQEKVDNFVTSVKMWSTVLGDKKLKIAAPVNQAATKKGDLPIADVQKEVEVVKGLNLPNFAGYALWDASFMLNDVLDGKTYDLLLREALDGASGTPTTGEQLSISTSTSVSTPTSTNTATPAVANPEQAAIPQLPTNQEDLTKLGTPAGQPSLLALLAPSSSTSSSATSTTTAAPIDVQPGKTLPVVTTTAAVF